jgi:hypothetical protein
MVNRWVWESGPGWWERLFKTGFWCGEWSVGLRCLSAPVYISLVMKKVPYFPLKRRSLWSPDLPMSEGQDPGETVKCASPGHVCECAWVCGVGFQRPQKSKREQRRCQSLLDLMAAGAARGKELPRKCWLGQKFVKWDVSALGFPQVWV